MRFNKPAPLLTSTGVGKKTGLSLLVRATFDYIVGKRMIADRYRCGAPPKLYDDLIYHAELVISRAYFFSRWCVIAGIAIDKPKRSRGKRGKKNKVCR